jgi:integrase
MVLRCTFGQTRTTPLTAPRGDRRDAGRIAKTSGPGRDPGATAPRTSYHSFRHCFRDALREAQASDEIVDALLGWTRRTMRETHGSGPRIAALAEAVARVDYPGLDLGCRALVLTIVSP